MFSQNNPLPPMVVKPYKRESRDTHQPSLDQLWAGKNAKRHRSNAIANQIQKEQQSEPAASVFIPYRDDGIGKGSAFDMSRGREITARPTVLVSEVTPSALKSYLTSTITHSQEDETDIMPPVINPTEDMDGLLYIPGISRETRDRRQTAYQERRARDFALIKKALQRGQPILASCGGSWHLWEYFDGKLKEVHEHNCRAGMPRISETTGKVGFNIQVHGIAIKPEALLFRSAIAYGQLGHTEDKTFPVNSVHWLAPNETTIPHHFMVSATSVQLDDIAPMSVTGSGNKMKPEENVVEVFESKFHAPIIGVGYHFEAYAMNAPANHFPANQRHIYTDMAKAGQTYKNRRHLVANFQAKTVTDATFFNRQLKPTIDPVTKKSVLSNHTVIRKEDNHIVSFQRFALRKLSYFRHVDEIYREIKMKEAYVIEKKSLKS